VEVYLQFPVCFHGVNKGSFALTQLFAPSLSIRQVCRLPVQTGIELAAKRKSTDKAILKKWTLINHFPCSNSKKSGPLHNAVSCHLVSTAITTGEMLFLAFVYSTT
jgi:hypothetical protein